MEKKEITIDIKKPEIIILTIVLLAIFILELRVTSTSPIVFGDEGFHTRLAQYIGQEKDYPVYDPYGQTKIIKQGFSRPPLWNLLEGSFLFIFGFHEIIIKSLTPFIASILTGFGIYLLGKRIFGKEISFFASLITVTIPSFLTYSVLFYTDALFVFYFSLFVLTFSLSIKTGDKKYLILSSVFGALSFLTKTPGFAVFPLIILGFLYQVYKEKKIVNSLKNYITLFLILFLIISTFFLRNLIYYHTPSCDIPILNRDGCKVTFNYKNGSELPTELEQAGTAVNIFKMGIINYFDFAYGYTWFVPFLLICGLFIIFYKITEENILIILAIISFIPVIYLTISPGTRAEDTARYTLGLVPLIAIICGIYLDKIYDIVKKRYKKISIFVVIAVIIYIIFGLMLFGIRGYGTIDKLFGYNTMQNGQEVHTAGLYDIKQFSSSFLEACDFVKKNATQDAILITVWASQSSYSCQRNVVSFFALPDSGDIMLSGNLSLTISRLKAHGITHIFIQKFSISSTPTGEKYPISFIQFLENNSNNFVKIYENGPQLQQCLQTGGCDGNIIYEINYTQKV